MRALDLATTGLTEREAAERLACDGPNELATGKRRGFFADALATAREPMSFLLLACGLVYLVLGDHEEALMLLAFVFFILGITLYQERKTGRALEALRDLSSPRALVVRGGVRRRIAGREVVRGDVVVLAEGDRVPADAVILDSTSCSVDESWLTGESVPVRKSTWDGELPLTRPGGDDLPFVFSGTLVVQGSAVAEVRATGSRTELGKIGRALERAPAQQTLLEDETRALVGKLAIVSATLSVSAFVLSGLLRGHWLEGLLAGLTLAMAIMPNEFPVVVTIFLALGAWRLSRRRVLTRRAAAVEMLGATTVLCVDKTGTLTENRMSVRELLVAGLRWSPDRTGEPLPEELHALVEYSILASRPDPFDPMEQAFAALGARYLADTEHLHHDWKLVREYPLSREMLAVSQAWSARGSPGHVVAMKGAPEAVADLCHLDDEALATLAEDVSEMAERGLRVLAVARGRRIEGPLPEGQHDFDFDLLGLVGLSDPVRAGVPQAVAECHSAGIRVVMISGDYPATAQAIARQIGLPRPDDTLTGAELEPMSERELRERIRTASVFARVLPEQKLRLVEALRANGEVVAMTGDGVNDAPALKAAHIGIAMGGRGTDVAREAASVVLLDDDFASLVDAIRAGRRIVDNLKKALAYILAVHLPIIGLSLIPIVMRWPLVLLPVHIAFLHLVIDPACSIVFEAESDEADVMKRPPRDPKQPLFGRRIVGTSLLQGAGVLVLVVGLYAWALASRHGELDSRALAFCTLVLANVGLIFSNRSWSRPALATLAVPNRALWWVTAGALGFLALVVSVPTLRTLFRFERLHADDAAMCALVGAASFAWSELWKVFHRATTRA